MKKIISNQKSPKNFKFGNLVFAGLLGTIAFNAVMYADISITGIPLDIVAVLGNLAAGESEYSQTIGQAIHLANGVGLSLFFGYVVLPISKKITKQPLIIYAVLFAAFETVIGVWFGMLPTLGAGIAGLEIDPLVPIITLIRHIVYGLVLGMILTLRKVE
ncbi:MAG: hypothetical protein ISR79_06040 [Nitrosopumilus sp.]|nr:hypothetical protein [Nitrosopumilus sp.]